RLFLLSSLLFSTLVATPPSTLFPYTTLFRSLQHDPHEQRGGYDQPIDRYGRGALSDRLLAELRCGAALGAKSVPGMCCQNARPRSEEHTSELQSRENIVFRLLL